MSADKSYSKKTKRTKSVKIAETIEVYEIPNRKKSRNEIEVQDNLDTDVQTLPGFEFCCNHGDFLNKTFYIESNVCFHIVYGSKMITFREKAVEVCKKFWFSCREERYIINYDEITEMKIMRPTHEAGINILLYTLMFIFSFMSGFGVYALTTEFIGIQIAFGSRKKFLDLGVVWCVFWVVSLILYIFFHCYFGYGLQVEVNGNTDMKIPIATDNVVEVHILEHGTTQNDEIDSDAVIDKGKKKSKSPKRSKTRKNDVEEGFNEKNQVGKNNGLGKKDVKDEEKRKTKEAINRNAQENKKTEEKALILKEISIKTGYHYHAELLLNLFQARLPKLNSADSTNQNKSEQNLKEVEFLNSLKNHKIVRIVLNIVLALLWINVFILLGLVYQCQSNNICPPIYEATGTNQEH